jgi:hypothetical protein
MNMKFSPTKHTKKNRNELWSIKEKDDERSSKYKVGVEIKWKATKINTNANH